MGVPRFIFSIRLILITVAVCGCALALGRFLITPITVTVINEMPGTLRDIRISYTGGERTATVIAPGGRTSWRIRPHGDSGLTIMYRDESGRVVTNETHVYMETGWWGSLDLCVRPDGVKEVNRIWAW